MSFRIIALPFLTGYTRERCKEQKSKSRGSSAKKQAILLHSFYGPLQESKFGMEMPKVPVVSRYFVAYLASFVAFSPFVPLPGWHHRVMMASLRMSTVLDDAGSESRADLAAPWRQRYRRRPARARTGVPRPVSARRRLIVTVTVPATNSPPPPGGGGGQ